MVFHPGILKFNKTNGNHMRELTIEKINEVDGGIVTYVWSAFTTIMNTYFSVGTSLQGNGLGDGFEKAAAGRNLGA
jgi:hypothetical protein